MWDNKVGETCYRHGVQIIIWKVDVGGLRKCWDGSRRVFAACGGSDSSQLNPHYDASTHRRCFQRVLPSVGEKGIKERGMKVNILELKQLIPCLTRRRSQKLPHVEDNGP